MADEAKEDRTWRALRPAARAARAYRARAGKEREDWEENNFLRLTETKKDKQKRKAVREKGHRLASARALRF
jgi:hypothetical protein